MSNVARPYIHWCTELIKEITNKPFSKEDFAYVFRKMLNSKYYLNAIPDYKTLYDLLNHYTLVFKNKSNIECKTINPRVPKNDYQEFVSYIENLTSKKIRYSYLLSALTYEYIKNYPEVLDELKKIQEEKAKKQQQNAIKNFKISSRVKDKPKDEHKTDNTQKRSNQTKKKSIQKTVNTRVTNTTENINIQVIKHNTDDACPNEYPLISEIEETVRQLEEQIQSIYNKDTHEYKIRELEEQIRDLKKEISDLRIDFEDFRYNIMKILNLL